MFTGLLGTPLSMPGNIVLDFLAGGLLAVPVRILAGDVAYLPIVAFDELAEQTAAEDEALLTIVAEDQQ